VALLLDVTRGEVRMWRATLAWSWAQIDHARMASDRASAVVGRLPSGTGPGCPRSAAIDEGSWERGSVPHERRRSVIERKVQGPRADRAVDRIIILRGSEPDDSAHIEMVIREIEW